MNNEAPHHIFDIPFSRPLRDWALVQNNSLMKNVVSFETAKALRDAGFLQPKPEPGQFWYDDTKRLFVIAAVGTTSVTGMWIERGTAFQSKMNEFDVFAPTATDILEHLGRHFTTSKDSETNWIVRHHDLSENGKPICTHGNHAEASAKMWLQVNKK